MTDEQILERFRNRDEAALSASDGAHGIYCRMLAERFVAAEDAQECWNDALLRAWNAIPPEHPAHLRAYLARLTRNAALDRWRANRAEKRGGCEADAVLDELLARTERAVMIAVPFFARKHMPVATPSAAAETSEPEWEASYTPAESETDDPDITPEVSAPMQTDKRALPAPSAPVAPMIERYKLDADACYAMPRNGEVNRSMPLRAAMDEYGATASYRVIVELLRDEQVLPADGAEVLGEVKRLAALGYVVAYETLTGKDGQAEYLFTLHADYDRLADFPASADYGYMLFLYGEREKTADSLPPVAVNEVCTALPAGPVPAENAAVCTALPAGPVPAKNVEVCAAAPFPGETLTEAQAYADADLGAYLCDAPDGFAEREFTRMNGVLTANFLRGYDYVSWHVSRAADGPAVDAAGLTPELVAARMYRADDAGDSDGLRIMNFCVDYGGVFVRVTAKGVSPEWLYQQLAAQRS